MTNADKKRYLKLAADLLDQASEEFSGHGCNDVYFPENWTRKQRRQATKEMYLDAFKSNEEFEEEDCEEEDFKNTCDWMLMSFMANKLRELAKL